MPTYQVIMLRGFIVTIDAESKEDAALLSEFYMGYYDGSSDSDRQKLNFRIQEIDMTVNDAIEVIPAD